MKKSLGRVFPVSIKEWECKIETLIPDLGTLNAEEGSVNKH